MSPLPPVDSPTAESPGYVTESDPEEDPEEYEDDETKDGPVDYPMDGGDDGDDDDGNSSGDDADDEDEMGGRGREDCSPQTLRLRCLVDAVTAGIYITPTTTYLYTNFYHPPIDRRDDIPGQAAPIIVCQHRRGLKRDDKEISEVGNGIRETWVDLAEASSGDSTTTLGEVCTRVAETC
ncbi:hypothetical protein Tco_1226427 [Tanacetum coccineum]